MNNQRNFMVPTASDELIAWCNKKYSEGYDALPISQYRLNLAYATGRQWVAWDKAGKVFRKQTFDANDPNAPVVITVNKISPLQERTVAKLLKNAPEAEVRPITNDEDDVGAAKAATRILQSEFQRLQWEVKLMELCFWTTTHGVAYFHVMWEPSAGDVMGQVDGENVTTGDVILEAVPAEALVIAPGAKSLVDARWAIYTRAMSREDVWDKYGVVPTGDSASNTMTVQARMLQGTDRRAAATGDIVNVHQLWMRPWRGAPEGMVVTWSGATELERTPWRYNNKKLPFMQCDLLPGLGTIEGRTWVSDLIPVQADYNDARSREAQIRRTLVPKVMSPMGAIEKDSYTSTVEVIEYAPVGDKPSVHVPDSGWMRQYEESMNRADTEMGERAGISEVSSGKAGASMPAAAILALQEQDDTKLSISFKLLSDCIRGTAEYILGLVKQFWSEERLVRTYSEEGSLEVKYFSNSDISRPLDVTVSVETGIARSKSAMVQMGMDLWNAGIIKDPAYLLKLVQAPNTTFLLEALNVDTKQAERENEYLLLGEQVEVNAFDNHAVHIEVIDNLRKSEEYDKLRRAAKAGDPDSIAKLSNIDAHAQIHYEMLAAKAPMAAGMVPEGPPAQSPESPEASSAIEDLAGIGGAGEPGAIPGVTPDEQAASMGQ